MRLNKLDNCNHWTGVTVPAENKPNHLLVRNSASNLQLGSYAAKKKKSSFVKDGSRTSLYSPFTFFLFIFLFPFHFLFFFSFYLFLFSFFFFLFFLFFFFYRNRVWKRYVSRDGLLYLNTWRRVA